jgi:hypothetical protein
MRARHLLAAASTPAYLTVLKRGGGTAVASRCYRSPWTPDVAPFSFTQREGFGGGGTSMSIAGFSPGSVVVG